MSKIVDLAKELKEEMISHRRQLHTNAEIGFELPNTVKYVMSQLREMGYNPQEIGKSGIVAILKGEEEGKTILLRADMDALPMKEETDLDFKSITGNMHACGHDMHTAMLLGAAKILKQKQSELKGTVKFCFQPAEEILQGAPAMIESGLLKNPHVDVAFMIHVLAGMKHVKTGKLLFLEPGESLASNDRFDIKIKGVGCHGGMPHAGIDPIIPATAIHTAIHTINSREFPSGTHFVATTGQINAGTAANIIPNEVCLSGTIRTFNTQVREKGKMRIKEIAEHIAKAYRCSANIEYSSKCPPFNIDAVLNSDVYRYALDEIGEQNIAAGSAYGLPKVPGSEDFAFVSVRVPTTVVILSADVPDKTLIRPQHHPEVRFSESVLARGAALYSTVALKWLEEHK